MAANVESMFYVRETPWHGIGTRVEEALSSADALRMGGLDWPVLQFPACADTPAGRIIDPDHFFNVRKVGEDQYDLLGVVGKQYTVIQNVDAFAFADELLGEGVKFETAISLNNGKRVVMLAIMPNIYHILGDEYKAYIVFTNTHDGTGSFTIAMTPIRVVCQNTLNAALSTAKRSWKAIHKRSVNSKIDEARRTLGLAEVYMQELNKEMEQLAMVKISPIQFEKIILPTLFKVDEDAMSQRQIDSVMEKRAELRFRYQKAPDLQGYGSNGARLIQAVADYVDHTQPQRATANWKENRFASQIQGNELLDQARDLVLKIA